MTVYARGNCKLLLAGRCVCRVRFVVFGLGFRATIVRFSRGLNGGVLNGVVWKHCVAI